MAAATPNRIRYYGPWPKIEWDPAMTLVLLGPAGCGKTQWALYLAEHMSSGDYCYVQGACDKLKRIYSGEKVIIFDNIGPFEKWTVSDWCSLLDTENECSVNMRHRPLNLTPGARILIDTEKIWPENSRLKRRLYIYNVEGTLV